MPAKPNENWYVDMVVELRVVRLLLTHLVYRDTDPARAEKAVEDAARLLEATTDHDFQRR